MLEIKNGLTRPKKRYEINEEVLYKHSEVLEYDGEPYRVVFAPKSAITHLIKDLNSVANTKTIEGEMNPFDCAAAYRGEITRDRIRKLTVEESVERYIIFISVCLLHFSPEVMLEVVRSAPKKKDKTLIKRRVQHLYYTGMANDDKFYELCAVNETENVIEIEIRHTTCHNSSLEPFKNSPALTDFLETHKHLFETAVYLPEKKIKSPQPQSTSAPQKPRDAIEVEAYCLKQLAEKCSPKDKIIVKIPEGSKRVFSAAFSPQISIYSNEDKKYADSIANRIVGVIIPEGVEVIDAAAFDGCKNLKYIELPNTLREIHLFAFMNCKKLKYFPFPKSLNYMNDEVFYSEIYAGSRGVSSVLNTVFEYPNTVYYGEAAWTGSTHTESIRTENNLIIKERALVGTYGNIPNPLVIPEGICAIKRKAFLNQNGHPKKAGEIILPDSLVDIEPFALRNVGKVTNLPKNLRYIGEHAFDDCKDPGPFAAILSASIDGFPIFLDNGKIIDEGYRIVNGLIYRGTVLVGCIEKQPCRVIIEPGTTEIDYIILNDEYWVGVEEVVFPNSLKIVRGFSHIPKSIKKLIFSEGLEIIDSNSFSYWDELEEVVLPDSVKIVGIDSFCSGRSDKRIRISASKNTFFADWPRKNGTPEVLYRD